MRIRRGSLPPHRKRFRYVRKPSPHPRPQRARSRARKEQRRRGAEERDQKEARGTHNPSPGAPRERATKSVLGLCFIPVIRFSPLVLIVASPNRQNAASGP